MSDTFWMIADISQINDSFSGGFLDQKKAPRAIHYEQDLAETELLRLQARHPDGEFVLLEAVATAQTNRGGILVIEPIEEM